MKNRRSFFFKLLISYLLIGVLPVATLGIFASVITYNLSIKKLENQSIQMAYTSLDSFNEMIGDYKDTLELCAKDDMVKKIITSKSVQEYEKNLLYQKISLLFSGKVTDQYTYLIRKNGDVIFSSIGDKKRYTNNAQGDWGIFRELNNREDAFLYPERYYSIYGKKISLSIAKRITVDGSTAGYMIIDLPKSTIEKSLTAKGNLLDMNYLIMDKNFYIMYDDLLKDDAIEFFPLDFRDKLIEKKVYTGIEKINNRSGLLFSLESPENGVFLLAEVPVETILMNNQYIVWGTELIVLIAVILCCVLTFIITNRISKPIRKIVSAMEKVEKGDINTRVELQGIENEIGYMARRFNEMVESLNDLFQKNMEKQDRLRLAEIKSLQSQINPHFLYNTLDSIKWLAKLNGVDEISVIVSKLGNLLKNSINNYDDLVTVEESMFLIDSYLSIQQIRFSGKFDVEIDIDESIMKCLVPKLVIQPIVENAIVHGIENKIGKSIVKIIGKREDDSIVFEVVDDGIGISEADLEKLRDSVALENSSKNIALSNINNRIKLYYGEKYGLEIFSEKDKGTRVRVMMPVNDGCNPEEGLYDSNRDR